ncbi:hypothetical protein HYV85_00695 [Candidatus Woesearchaeota archaeon]|nr:hypothetical protein [Candidatus Woesearchaeota archaeon]
MVFPTDWFYRAAVEYDRITQSLIPALRDLPQARAYLEGFVAAYAAISAIDAGLHFGLKSIKRENWLKPLRSAGYATMCALPLIVSAIDPEGAKQVHELGNYLEGIVGLMMGTGAAAFQGNSGYSYATLATKAINRFKGNGKERLEQKLR